MKQIKNVTGKSRLSKEDLERFEILQKAEEVKGEQLAIDLDSGLVVENEAEALMSKKIDDPVEKFQLYYKGLRKMLLDFLPKGREYEQARNMIYDEKNILINRGARKDEKGLRGSDGRMARLDDLEMAIQIVALWISKKGSYWDLYKAFWNKNEELGYGHQN
ncbi:hypothetical protein [Prosthecochloris vibrioformis]|uniref:Uncharacterized protein n=1 Tax=Prosthecochloris vibrioformis TaxID=1098 RepID=A0A5C4RTS7_PROVB|nr:hypothetical protein [Prosthecochloris vibrioformis]TNJ34017.1 hypothetical protein FGF68_10740 [Prosthecochloris vibrioformis]